MRCSNKLCGINCFGRLDVLAGQIIQNNESTTCADPEFIVTRILTIISSDNFIFQSSTFFQFIEGSIGVKSILQR